MIRSNAFASLLVSATMLLLSAALTGCAAQSRYMAPAPVPAPPLAPSPGVATVAFIRTSGFGGAVIFTIVDQNGRFVGDSTAGGHFVSTMPPGEYLFIAEGENTAVMHANVAPGRLYYVSVEPRMGVFYARVALEPIKPGSRAWEHVTEDVSDTTRYVALAGGQAAMQEKAESVAKRIANAKDKWAHYSPEERAEFALEPNDGEALEPPPPPPAPPAGAQAPPAPAPAVVPPAAPPGV